MALTKIQLSHSIDYWRQRYNELIDLLDPDSLTSVFTTTPTANKVPRADANGLISDGWMGADADILPDVAPSLQLDFRYGIPSFLTFTRNSYATCRGFNNMLRLVPPGEPRFHHEYSDDDDHPRGIIIHPISYTNLVLKSEAGFDDKLLNTFTNINTDTIRKSSPYGEAATDMVQWTASTNNTQHKVQMNLTSLATASADTIARASCFFYLPTGSDARVGIRIKTTGGVNCARTYDPLTDTFVTADADVACDTVRVRSEKYTGGWTQITVGANRTNGGSDTWQFEVYLTLDSDLTDIQFPGTSNTKALIFGTGFYSSSTSQHMPMYMPSVPDFVPTFNAESLTIPNFETLEVGGVPIFNPDAFSLALAYTHLDTAAAGNQKILSLSRDASNYIELVSNQTGIDNPVQARLRVVTASPSVVNLSKTGSDTYDRGDRITSAFALDASSIIWGLNGDDSTIGSDATDARLVASSAITLNIGYSVTGAFNPTNCVERLVIYNKKLNAEQLQALLRLI